MSIAPNAELGPVYCRATRQAIKYEYVARVQTYMDDIDNWSNVNYSQFYLFLYYKSSNVLGCTPWGSKPSCNSTELRSWHESLKIPTKNCNISCISCWFLCVINDFLCYLHYEFIACRVRQKSIANGLIQSWSEPCCGYPKQIDYRRDRFVALLLRSSHNS